jgi:hypothetical protein
MPFHRAQLAKIDDSIATQQRFTASKNNTTTCCLVIEIVHHHLVEDLLHIHLAPDAFSLEALCIKTVLTAQRTAMKGYEGGHALSVSSQSVTTNTD